MLLVVYIVWLVQSKSYYLYFLFSHDDDDLSSQLQGKNSHLGGERERERDVKIIKGTGE